MRIIFESQSLLNEVKYSNRKLNCLFFTEFVGSQSLLNEVKYSNQQQKNSKEVIMFRSQSLLNEVKYSNFGNYSLLSSFFLVAIPFK